MTDPTSPTDPTERSQPAVPPDPAAPATSGSPAPWTDASSVAPARPTPPTGPQGTWGSSGAVPETRIETVERESGTFGAPGTEASGRRRSGLRWAVALGGLAIVIAATAAIVLLAGGRPTPSAGLAWMPDDVVQYAEFRLDLPGDQRTKLATFLSSFPGFKDQAQLETKLGEAFDRFLGAATDDEVTWTRDIAPWFGGQVALGMGDIAGFGMMPTSTLGGATPEGLVVLTLSDPTRAGTWLDEMLEESGAGAERTTHGDAQLWTTGSDGSDGTIGIVEEVMLIGTGDSVRDAVDRGGNGTLAETEGFKAAFGTVERDYLAFSFIDYRSYFASIAEAIGQQTDLDATTVDEELLAMVPAWQASSYRVEDDALVGESVSPAWKIGFESENRAGSLAAHLPASTVFAWEVHDVGPALSAVYDRFKALPELEDGFAEMDQTLGLLGGFDAIAGWWGDAAVVVTEDAGAIGGGIVLSPTDVGEAEDLFGAIESYVSFGGGTLGIELREEEHAGRTISIVDLTEAVGSTGQLPEGMPLELAWTVGEEVVIVGYGADFVRDVLDAAAGESLADLPRYQAALDRVGDANLGLTWLDVGRLIELVEPILEETSSAEAWAEYETEIRPYLEPFGVVVQGAVRDGDTDRTRMVITTE